MPVSHIGLTVSHLPTSTSFFLSALQPLGYRYIGQSGNQVGLGIREADFFLCQETPGVKAGAAHIAFTAPSTTAVRNFYTAALTAGGRPNGAPATRSDEDGHFNAAILDFDGNSIEVVFRNGPDLRDDGTVIEYSRVITWQRSVSESYRDDRSVVSSRTAASRQPPAELISKPASVVSKAPSVAPSIARSVSEPIAVQQTTTSSDVGDGVAKKIIGTLLGAAAGAAVAYAMVRSEQDSAKKESDFSAFMDAKATVKAAVGHLAQASPQSAPPVADPQLTLEAPPPAPQSVHRNIDAQSYHSSTPSQARSVYAQRQIEPAPASYYSPTHISKAPTQITEPRAIEYAPAYSVAPSQARSRYTAQRSVTSPEFLTIEKARSVASTAKPHSVVSMSKPQSVAHSVAPSSLISSFVPDVNMRSSEGSVHSHHSSRSKSKSHVSRHTSHSKHSSSSRRGDETGSSAPTPPPASRAPSKAPSKAASLVGSILGRDAKSTTSKYDDLIDDFEIEELTEDDIDTVVPSDSISNAGSSSRRSHRSHRSHRSKKNDDESVISKHSSTSKHSKHSHRSHKSHKSRSHHDSDASGEDSSKPRRSTRPSVVSEPSDASTVKPIKSSSRAGTRKDSLTQGQYDGLFDEVQYGTGSVATMPIRGITPSMISAAGKNKSRGVINYNMAQKMRAFEGSEAR
ncbi:hypothetical protein BKA66DRAFT_466721 [Pyrenochaeta sp. MPI-SDFR-AT-0127]|nr:hypothetical protein BKA66DRAFT_466721 [Pyrenochaeta sp. MPI-SDFR-AT-0127]